MVGVQQDSTFRGTVMGSSPTSQENHQFGVKNVITGSLLELYIDLMIHTSWTGNIRVFQDLISLVGAL